jgi:hypothetical protein
LRASDHVPCRFGPPGRATEIKTSQLIDRLHKTIDHYGDLEVVVGEVSSELRKMFDLGVRTNGGRQNDRLSVVQIYVVLI